MQQARLADPGHLRDLSQRAGLEALLAEDGEGGVQDAGARLNGLAVLAARSLGLVRRDQRCEWQHLGPPLRLCGERSGDSRM
jgi:hypothetical protein